MKLNETERGAHMEDAISISSDESNVEIVESCGTLLPQADPPPLSALRVDVTSIDDVTEQPQCYFDLGDKHWSFPHLKLHKRLKYAFEAVIDLTETDADGTDHGMQHPLPNVSKLYKESTVEEFSNKGDSRHLAATQGNVPKQQHLGFQEEHLKQTSEAHGCQQTPAVASTRLPLFETDITGLKKCFVVLNKDCAKMTTCTDICKNSKTLKSVTGLTTATASNILEMEPKHKGNYPVNVITPQMKLKQDNSRQLQYQDSKQPGVSSESSYSERRSDNTAQSSNDNKNDEFFTSKIIPSTCSLFSQVKQENELHCFNMKQLHLDNTESDQSHPSDQSSPFSSQAGMNSPESFNYNSLSHTSPICHTAKREVGSPLTSEFTTAEKTPEWQFEHEEYQEVLENDSPISHLWQDESEFEAMNEKSSFGINFRAVSEEDRHYVCPVSLEKLMARPTPTLFDEDDEGFGPPEMLCRQNLSLVYSTIDEKYSEGTLELLRDLLQPGHYPPQDITSHLLRNILLDPHCPRHLCVQAFTLLMRTQRHHRANKTTIPWDWELLTSVMADQKDDTMKHQSEVVRMLLEYVVQTLEDDFQAKLRTSTLHLSIAKATLSCDQQFSRVRDVIEWLFSAITKSTKCVASDNKNREKDEHVRMVSIFQRMLSLALEVDRSRALNSAKLSQELFHMLISDVPLRAHRMLLLETLQSLPLRCKLLEHLLDDACPLKSSLPMSLSLLLHYLKNCTPLLDPLGQAEKWQKWEELVDLLWMLLLSYNKAMKEYLCGSTKNQRIQGGTLVYKTHDLVSKAAVREAVDAFLSRSKDDLGQSLPFHVEESLTNLQEYLLDVCQNKTPVFNNSHSKHF